MKVAFACVAEHAEVVDKTGKLSISGIFDRIFTKSFPAVHPQMCLVFRLLCEYEDTLSGHILVTKLQDPDGKELAHMKAMVQVSAVAPGDFATINQIYRLVNVGFPKPGRYRFSVQIGDEEEVRVPLTMVQG
jgi:hypothetical protein